MSIEQTIFNPEVLHQIPGYVIFAVAMGWIIKRFQDIINQYNKVITEMSEKCRETQLMVAKEHREAINRIVDSFESRMTEITKELHEIRNITSTNAVRIEDIHESVVLKKGKKRGV